MGKITKTPQIDPPPITQNLKEERGEVQSDLHNYITIGNINKEFCGLYFLIWFTL